MHSKLAALLLLPVLAAANPVPQATSGNAPSPDQITIVDTTYSGNGCPQGSVSTSTSTDKTVVTYGFDAFQTYIGPGTTPADRSKNCQLHLNLKYPGGFQYAVVDATYHGWARLDQGVTGSFITTYYFSQDAGKTQTTRMSAVGGGALAAGQVYTKQDSVETTATIWSPCGQNGILNVNNRIALSNNKAEQAGEMSNDDATVAFTQQLHVAWRACTPGSGGSGGSDSIGIGKPSSEISI
ncbi:secreted protein [Stemphylium lycopersici]|uniref:Secreted protein n=1 Tax=Stemphylium lycopersici TaxID=183478 RepID=A0A364NDQ1_STELY|nr:secreted protein [Stemphylium lycopersici]RAR10661.1 secreted protein [Stemphylium lycopersici]RAR15392.1 secreted protein [Stemphylium lycopersici]